MKGLVKKLAASTLAIVLVIAMGTQCFAATWGSYFGGNEGWDEAAVGKVNSQSSSGWTATLDPIGYGGIWGAQVFQDTAKKTGKVNVKKGQSYTLSFTMKSSNIDKWVYIKVATGEKVAYADWIELKKGKNYNYKVTFKAKNNANAIYFGIGGEFGDRSGVSTEPDAQIRYSYFKGDISQLDDEDPTYATKITLSNFKITGYIKAVKNKKTNIKNLNKFLKANGKITAKQNGYKCTIKRSGSSVVLQAVKGKKKVVNIKVKTSNYKKVFKKINKKGAKALDKVLKANTGLTLKNLGK